MNPPVIVIQRPHPALEVAKVEDYPTYLNYKALAYVLVAPYPPDFKKMPPMMRYKQELKFISAMCSKTCRIFQDRSPVSLSDSPCFTCNHTRRSYPSYSLSDIG